MKKQTMRYFFIGILIAFTIAILILSFVMEFTTDAKVIPVVLILESFVLSILCSLINLVYQSEKIKFIWKSIIGYVLTTTTIITCGLIFDWYGYSGNNFKRTEFIFISFLGYSLCYLITWIIIRRAAEVKKRELNDKLRAYKQKQ